MTQSPDIHIENAAHADIQAITAITRSRNNRASFGFIMRVVLEAAIDEQAEVGEAARNRLLVARDSQDRVVGFVRIYHRRDGQTTLHELGVSEDWQSRGVGSTLLRRCIDIVRAQGQQTRVCLSTPQELRSNAYYPRFGFVQTGERAGRKRRLNLYTLELR